MCLKMCLGLILWILRYVYPLLILKSTLKFVLASPLRYDPHPPADTHPPKKKEKLAKPGRSMASLWIFTVHDIQEYLKK